MGRIKRDRNADADKDLARLRSEYDADKGGYTIIHKGGNRRGVRTPDKTEFIKSSYTPEQGGYYADKSLTVEGRNRRTGQKTTSFKYYDADRAAYISGSGGSNPTIQNQIKAGGGGSVGREKTIAARKSAMIPRKRVNPTVRNNRRGARRERALKFGREGTILTGTLGGSQTDDRKKRKTLLG